MFLRNVVIENIYIHLEIKLQLYVTFYMGDISVLKCCACLRFHFNFQHSWYFHYPWHCSTRKMLFHQTWTMSDELIGHNNASRDVQRRCLRSSWTWNLLGWVVALQTQPGASTASHHTRVTGNPEINFQKQNTARFSKWSVLIHVQVFENQFSSHKINSAFTVKVYCLFKHALKQHCSYREKFPMLSKNI